ncbi:MAG: DUF1573 domain-containing protein [Spirochaetes bacterium]|nr:DUF1573 domain-containing protein [Spirochaetota bacterium]
MPIKKTIIPVLLFTVMVSCLGTPKIKFDSVTHDFGKQRPNVEKKYVFTFLNNGDGTLRIKDIKAG